MKLKRLLFAAALIITTSSVLQAQKTKVIAHRGFWKTPGSAQNSITGVIKADSIDCYGSEIDVFLTADNILILNHDNTYKGIDVQAQPAKEVTSQLLSNGEHLPTLKAYLKQAKKMKPRIILELKSHVTPQRETRAVEEVVKMVKKMKLEKRTDYIVFSKHALKEFIRLAPKGTEVYYLNGELSPKELKELGSVGLDYNREVLRKNPQWIKECQELGMKVNVWTVNNEEEMKWFIDQGVDFITTDEPLLLKQLLKM